MADADRPNAGLVGKIRNAGGRPGVWIGAGLALCLVAGAGLGWSARQKPQPGPEFDTPTAAPAADPTDSMAASTTAFPNTELATGTLQLTLSGQGAISGEAPASVSCRGEPNEFFVMGISTIDRTRITLEMSVRQVPFGSGIHLTTVTLVLGATDANPTRITRGFAGLELRAGPSLTGGTVHLMAGNSGEPAPEITGDVFWLCGL